MFAEMKLGRLPVPADGKPRQRLQLRPYLDRAAIRKRKPSVPLAEGTQFQMLGNDRKGDCVLAAVGNGAIADAARSGQTIQFDEAAVVGRYDTMTGGQDVGLVPHDAYEELLREGYPSAGGGFPFVARASIDPHDIETLKLCVDLFGFVLIGCQMPLSAQRGGGVWTATDGPDGEPGSWGGHEMALVAYGPDGSPQTVATWGGPQDLDDPWLLKYVDDAEVLLSEYHLGLLGAVGAELLADARALAEGGDIDVAQAAVPAAPASPPAPESTPTSDPAASAPPPPAPDLSVDQLAAARQKRAAESHVRAGCTLADLCFKEIELGWFTDDDGKPNVAIIVAPEQKKGLAFPIDDALSLAAAIVETARRALSGDTGEDEPASTERA